jgi:hypothetical protein
MGVLQILDELPEAVVQRPGRIWNVFARSLGEQGADGRTSLAWRWAFTGACPSPVTLSTPVGRPPGRGELLAEAEASAELGRPGTDLGGQVMHARFVLQWLAGGLDALPLWNGGSENQHVSDGAEYPHTRAEIEDATTGRSWPGCGTPRPASPAQIRSRWASAGLSARRSSLLGSAEKQMKGRCPACGSRGGRRCTRSRSTSAGR